MKIVSSLHGLNEVRSALKRKGLRIGFVPTMGALHEGHLSLVRRALKENDAVVASIFVNPLQFGPKEDFRRYPRNLKRDAAILKKAAADVLFTPSASEFYPSHFQTEVTVKKLSRGLCGRTRPGHFAGVATVVAKLLNLVRPDTLYLGQKDYQQFRVIEQMVQDLAMPVSVRMCPIVRESDGLAMSSRNVFLSSAERRDSLRLNAALSEAQRLAKKGERSAARILKAVRNELKKARLGRVEYVELVDAASLEPVVQLPFNRKALVAVAVQFSKTRLLDNALLTAR